MPKGPNGVTRPADLIGAVVMAAKIATGEIQHDPTSNRVKSGKAGVRVRTFSLAAEEISGIARTTLKRRWS